MKLVFSQARKRREQTAVKVCEAMNIIFMSLALILTVTLLIHNLFL